MDSVNYGYSMKNIPKHSKSSCLYELIDKVEKVLKCMRWKALIFDREQAIPKYKCQQQCPTSTHKYLQFKNKKIPPTNSGSERI